MIKIVCFNSFCVQIKQIQPFEHLISVTILIKDYIKRLEKYGVKFTSGLCIELPLKEIINICPRTLRRLDSYFGLVNYLKSEYEVTLKITSNKNRMV